MQRVKSPLGVQADEVGLELADDGEDMHEHAVEGPFQSCAEMPSANRTRWIHSRILTWPRRWITCAKRIGTISLVSDG